MHRRAGCWAAVITLLTFGVPLSSAQSLALPDALVPQRQPVSHAGFGGSRDLRVAWARDNGSRPTGTTSADARSMHRIGEMTSNSPAEIGESLTRRRRVEGRWHSTSPQTKSEPNLQPVASRPESRLQPTQSKTMPKTSSSLASALDPGIVSTENPYGDMYDTNGLRPYKPGVRYDKNSGERDSSFFGMLFGSGRR